MKKILIYSTFLTLLALIGCQEEFDSTLKETHLSFTLKLLTEDVSTGIEAETRAPIPAVDEEKTINSLYLLFFEHHTEGEGKFVESYKVNTPVTANSTITIDLGKSGSSLTNSSDYSILAVANMEGYLESGTIDNFLDSFQGKTENEAIENTLAHVKGAADEGDDTQSIHMNNIVMSARTAKMADQQLVVTTLTRGVARFDVQNILHAQYNLVSVSIWGASAITSLWSSQNSTTPTHLQRFYGLKREAGEDALSDIVGGLYSFENFVSDPAQGDDITTCLVIGLESKGDPNTLGDPNKVYYYRININPKESSQSLKRNYVYRISVRKVLELGLENEEDAWKDTKDRLDVDINNWNLDEEGMILTDGTNTMAVPAKIIRLDPAGQTREFSIFTHGTGNLEITKSELPSGFTAELNGNILKVTATELPATEKNRTGSLELGFAGLRGIVEIIQEPMDDKFLNLNKSEIPSFAPLGVTTIVDGPIVVTSSHPWIAKLYNTDQGENPGFSFSNSSPVTEITQDETTGNELNIFTTGGNPHDDVRNGFILISLADYPEYNAVIVLTQRAKVSISLSPKMNELKFKPNGNPVISPSSSPGGFFEFTVNPGYDNGVVNQWEVEFEGIQKDFFSYEMDTNGSSQRLRIYAKGTNPMYPHLNLSDADIENVKVKVKLVGAAESPDTQVEMTLVHQRVTIKAATDKKVSKLGGELPDGGVTVELDQGLTWSATVIENSLETHNKLPHKGYLLNGTNEVEGINNQPSTTKMRVGFKKLLYPHVDVSPSVKIELTVDQNPNISTTIDVSQESFSADPVKIMDMRNTDWGSIVSGSAFTHFKNYINYETWFGPNGTGVKITKGSPYITGIATDNSNDPGNINSSYTYLHAGGRPRYYSTNRHKSINDWRKVNKRIVTYVCDDREGIPFEDGNSALKELGYVYTKPTSDGDAYINTLITDKPVMKYLLKDGPFSKGNWINYSQMDFHVDGISSGVTLSQEALDRGAVPVILDGNKNVPMLVVDPAGYLVFIGESQFFDYDCQSPTTSSPWNDHTKFLGNLISYILNAAQYGTHFTDHFLPGSTTYSALEVTP